MFAVFQIFNEADDESRRNLANQEFQSDFPRCRRLANENFGGENANETAQAIIGDKRDVALPKQKLNNQSSKTAAKSEKTKQTTIADDAKPETNLTAELKQTASETEDFSPKRKNRNSENNSIATETDTSGQGSIIDLLASAEVGGFRHTSRPFVVPGSLTIDLTRLKSKFRTRNLQYTQNEIMDKMHKESLEIVTTENYFALREKAFKLVKSPEQSSRRSVTLTEETVAGMAELKADLSLTHSRRFSSDEIFTSLLVIAFAPLYENGLL